MAGPLQCSAALVGRQCAVKSADAAMAKRKKRAPPVPLARAAAACPQQSSSRRTQQQWRVAAQLGDDDDDDLEDEEDLLEDEDELDESDFADLGQVKILEEQKQGPLLWSNYDTRFLHPEVLSLDKLAESEQLRQQQQSESLGKLLTRVPGTRPPPALTGAEAPSSAGTGSAGTQEAVSQALTALRQGPGLSTEVEKLVPEPHPLDGQREVWNELWDPPPEPMDEWDLRAMLEKQRRKQRDYLEWLEVRARVGQHVNVWSDWRTDVRITGTDDPTQPDYREWTHREIWDLITQNGRAADPRQVRVRVASPSEIADYVEQGARYHPETEDWIASLGRLIQEEEEEEIVDPEAEAALLDAEFSDFDEEQFKDLGGEYGVESYEDASFAAPDDF